VHHTVFEGERRALGYRLFDRSDNRLTIVWVEVACPHATLAEPLFWRIAKETLDLGTHIACLCNRIGRRSVDDDREKLNKLPVALLGSRSPSLAGTSRRNVAQAQHMGHDTAIFPNRQIVKLDHRTVATLEFHLPQCLSVGECLTETLTQLRAEELLTEEPLYDVERNTKREQRLGTSEQPCCYLVPIAQDKLRIEDKDTDLYLFNKEGAQPTLKCRWIVQWWSQTIRERPEQPAGGGKFPWHTRHLVPLHPFRQEKGEFGPPWLTVSSSGKMSFGRSPFVGSGKEDNRLPERGNTMRNRIGDQPARIQSDENGHGR